MRQCIGVELPINDGAKTQRYPDLSSFVTEEGGSSTNFLTAARVNFLIPLVINPDQSLRYHGNCKCGQCMGSALCEKEQNKDENISQLLRYISQLLRYISQLLRSYVNY